MKKCIVISDSFKGSLPSRDICAIARERIPLYFPACEVRALNVADGGEGTVDCSDLAAAQLRYEQGTISENALHTAEDELYTAQDTVSGAERDLFTAYNNYRWAVDYGLLAG